MDPSVAAGEHRRLAVIGGGISGLAAAHRLMELDPTLEVSVFEAGDRCGGIVGTEQVNGFCIELGPDSMLHTLPWGTSLCQRVGIADQLAGTNTQQQRTWVLRSGRLHPLPEGLAIMAPRRVWPIVRTPILSVRAKLRMACERFIGRRTEAADESLAAFARRRFGQETFERLMQPLVSGIYMADPERLSMRAALPRFVEMEAEYGSLIRAARTAVKEQQRRPSRDESPPTSPGGMFVAPRAGLGKLISAIADRLPDGAVRLRSPVSRLWPEAGGRWNLSVQGKSSPAVECFDGVIVAVPSDVAATLLRPLQQGLAVQLAAIEHSGCVVVTLAYSREEIHHPLNGHGFVVPQVEQREIIACTLSSVKYAGRAPEGQVLLRVFLGGAMRPHTMTLEDSELLNLVSRELNPLLDIRGRPRLTRITRWPRAMPQYHVGHLDLVDSIDAGVQTLPGIELAGNSYRGVGIPHCIHSGEQAAERLYKFLDDSPGVPHSTSAPLPSPAIPRRSEARS